MESILVYIPRILQLMLFLIMLGMGMTLTVRDFLNVGLAPRAVLVGLVNQIILLPAIAFTIVSVVPMQPLAAMGLMIVACCPGGAVSNLFSHLSGGDTALSISLTAVSSMITILTIPFIINFALDALLDTSTTSIRLPVRQTIVNIFKLTALPVLIGMFLKHKLPMFAEKSKAAIGWGSGVVILLALTLMVIKLEEIGDSWVFIKASFIGVILLNILSLSVGFGSARWLKLSLRQSVTIAIESGMQNNVLGMTIALSTTLLNEPRMAATAGVYGIVMCTIAVGIIFIFRKIISHDNIAITST